MHRLILPLVLAALAVPATATASEPVGVDPDTVYGATPQTCDDGCTIVQDVNANLAVRIPVLPGGRGVITSWKVRGSDGSARLRRLEGATARGATGWAVLTGSTQRVAASFPVRSGDRIGIDLSAGATIAGDESLLRRFRASCGSRRWAMRRPPRPTSSLAATSPIRPSWSPTPTATASATRRRTPACRAAPAGRLRRLRRRPIPTPRSAGPVPASTCPGAARSPSARRW